MRAAYPPVTLGPAVVTVGGGAVYHDVVALGDGGFVASASEGAHNQLHVFSPSGALLRRVSLPGSRGNALGALPGTQVVAVSATDVPGVRVYDTDSGERLAVMRPADGVPDFAQPLWAAGGTRLLLTGAHLMAVDPWTHQRLWESAGDASLVSVDPSGQRVAFVDFEAARRGGSPFAVVVSALDGHELQRSEIPTRGRGVSAMNYCTGDALEVVLGRRPGDESESHVIARLDARRAGESFGRWVPARWFPTGNESWGSELRLPGVCADLVRAPHDFDSVDLWPSTGEPRRFSLGGSPTHAAQLPDGRIVVSTPSHVHILAAGLPPPTTPASVIEVAALVSSAAAERVRATAAREAALRDGNRAMTALRQAADALPQCTPERAHQIAQLAAELGRALSSAPPAPDTSMAQSVVRSVASCASDEGVVALINAFDLGTRRNADLNERCHQTPSGVALELLESSRVCLASFAVTLALADIAGARATVFPASLLCRIYDNPAYSNQRSRVRGLILSDESRDANVVAAQRRFHAEESDD